MKSRSSNHRELEMLTTNDCPHCGGGVGYIAYSMGYCNWCAADLSSPPKPLDKYVVTPPEPTP